MVRYKRYIVTTASFGPPEIKVQEFEDEEEYRKAVVELLEAQESGKFIGDIKLFRGIMDEPPKKDLRYRW